jgi:hypothetical protein
MLTRFQAEWREAIRAAIPRMIEAPRKFSKDGLLLLAQIRTSLIWLFFNNLNPRS